MSAVLLAVFNEYEVADRVRTKLVGDGFPTDRVELTASCEPGRAGLHPAASARARFAQYFLTLLTEDEERPFVELLVERVECAVSIALPGCAGRGGRWQWADTASGGRAS